MRPRLCSLACAAAFPLLFALAAPAFAGGYVYVHRHQLPRDIARQHTCIGPRARTIMLPDQTRIGNLRLYEIACPVGAKEVVTFETRSPTQNAPPPPTGDDEGPLVYYLADNARGRNAVRLKFPYPKPDGTMLMADAMPSLSFGWSSRANSSPANNLAFLDPTRGDFPRGEFMLAGRFMPADRPQVENVFAIWHVKNGKASLAYWAEQTEKMPPDSPSWKLRYNIVVDQRPEK